MNYIRGSDRGQVLLMPEALEDYLSPENLVRFIDAFVGQLDLVQAGLSKAQLKETGRPPYDPDDPIRPRFTASILRLHKNRQAGCAALPGAGPKGVRLTPFLLFRPRFGPPP